MRYRMSEVHMTDSQAGNLLLTALGGIVLMSSIAYWLLGMSNQMVRNAEHVRMQSDYMTVERLVRFRVNAQLDCGRMQSQYGSCSTGTEVTSYDGDGNPLFETVMGQFQLKTICASEPGKFEVLVKPGDQEWASLSLAEESSCTL